MAERRVYEQRVIITALQMLDSGEHTMQEVAEHLNVPMNQLHSWRGAVKRHAEVEIVYKRSYGSAKSNWKAIADAVVKARKPKAKK